MHTCYSPVRRSPSGGVATSHAAPRLACVKPVASVHPEPGSNSSLCIIVFSFFLCIKRCHEHTDGLPLIHNVTPHWWPAATASPGARPLRAAGRPAAAPLISPVTRNLDFGELSGILASLSLTCLSDFLIANMSMISHRLPGTTAAAL